MEFINYRFYDFWTHLRRQHKDSDIHFLLTSEAFQQYRDWATKNLNLEIMSVYLRVLTNNEFSRRMKRDVIETIQKNGSEYDHIVRILEEKNGFYKQLRPTNQKAKSAVSHLVIYGIKYAWSPTIESSDYTSESETASQVPSSIDSDPPVLDLVAITRIHEEALEQIKAESNQRIQALELENQQLKERLERIIGSIKSIDFN